MTLPWPHFQRRSVASALLASVMLVLSACGQPIARPGAASTVGTPPPVSPTPSLALTTPQVAATQTAFAAIPTKSDLSPLAPTIEATLAIPTPTRDPNTGTRVTGPTPTAARYDPSQPCVLASIASSPGIQTQARSAQVIIVGVIVEVAPARWSTPNGQRPAMPPCGGQPPYDYIFTPVRVSVEQVVKGSISTSEIEVRLIGGTVGQDQLLMPQQAPLLAGERSVLFINVPNNSSIAGRYIVKPDGTAVEDVPPSRTFPLQQLLSEITAIIGASSPMPSTTPRPSPALP
jgi:hypothetical protein